MTVMPKVLWKNGVRYGSEIKNTLIPLNVNTSLFDGEMYFVDNGEGTGKLIGSLYVKNEYDYKKNPIVLVNKTIWLFDMPKKYLFKNMTVPHATFPVDDNQIAVINYAEGGYDNTSYGNVMSESFQILFKNGKVYLQGFSSGRGVLYNASRILTGTTAQGLYSYPAGYFNSITYTKS